MKRLDIESLKYSDIVFDYYKRNFNFVYVSNEGHYKNIPVRENISFLIEKVHLSEGLKYPWDEYAAGLTSQYTKGMPMPFIDDKEARLWHILTAINMPESDAISFDKDKVYEYGQKIAVSYLAWEIVIADLSSFETVFNKRNIAVSEFSSLLNHPQAAKIGNELTSLIQSQRGTGVGLYFLALEKMGLLNYSTRQDVYNSLSLDPSQCSGASTLINEHYKFIIEKKQGRIKEEGRTKEIEKYILKIKSVIEALSD